MRVLADRPATIQWRIADDTGQAVDNDVTPADQPSVTITDGGGTVVAGPVDPDDHPAVGAYTYTLEPQAQLDRLTATLTTVVNGYTRKDSLPVDVVGARLLPIEVALDDPVLGKLDARRVQRILDSIETQFRDIIDTPVVPEGARVSFDHRSSWDGGYDMPTSITGLPYNGIGTGGRLRIPGVRDPLVIYSLTVNSTVTGSQDLAAIRAADGALQWTDTRGWLGGRYDVWLAHGMPFPPEDLLDAAQTMARYLARRIPAPGKQTSLLPERTASITAMDGATIVFARPSREQPTGLPEVDVILTRYMDDAPI